MKITTHTVTGNDSQDRVESYSRFIPSLISFAELQKENQQITHPENKKICILTMIPVNKRTSQKQK